MFGVVFIQELCVVLDDVRNDVGVFSCSRRMRGDSALKISCLISSLRRDCILVPRVEEIVPTGLTT